MLRGIVRRAVQAASLWRQVRWSRKTAVLVYQMGKVGSASVYDSLRPCPRFDVFHVHRMNPANIDKVRREHAAAGVRAPNDRKGLSLHRMVKSGRRPVKVITCVREPIARNISAFFQNFERFTGLDHAKSREADKRLTDRFLREYRHDVPLKWFDDEPKVTLGVDVYARPFPHERGYARINHGHTDMLVLKCETDDAVKERAISEFLGLDDFALARSNVAGDKEYARLYRAFLDRVTLPESYVEEMYASRYARHFYTESEIERMRARWLRGLRTESRAASR